MEAKVDEGEVKTRIFVGGLGEKVTSDDLSKIFSSLGEVKAVEIVRTKGRSFGYVDFYPSSHKSLAKLFSTYNGCVWKGGRLRLEKAKEHYLARLKRAWEEDAQLLCTSVKDCVDADKEMEALEKPKSDLKSEKNLNIFFPRLRKVKSVPIRGTGKHKYSFQRLEVPSVPVYFCDCEEHSVPSHTADEGKQIHDLEAQSCAMNEEELNMMHSVMNKLFERENVSTAAQYETRPAYDGTQSTRLVDDLQFHANDADSVADEDNLIINVVSKGNKRIAEKTTISSINQKLPSCEIHTSKGSPLLSMPKVLKNNNLSSNKKRKAPPNEEGVRNELVSASPGNDMNMRAHKHELRAQAGSQPAGTKSGLKQRIANHSWSQKSSWKALVGDKGRSVFNVSNILPVVASAREAENAFEPIEDLQAIETDEDNLIINVVSKKNNKMALSRNQEQESNSTMIQKSTVNETKTSEDKPDQSVIKAKKKNTLSPKKKSKLLSDEKSDRNVLVSTTTEDNVNFQTLTKKARNPLGAQPTEPESDGKYSIASHSESPKSSGRALVADNNKNSFSVSNILADLSAKEEQPVADGPNISNSTDGKKQSLEKYENLKGKSDEAEIVDVLEGQPTDTKTNEASNKSGRGGGSWFQKSSWTQLITENNNSFSITQISPVITFKKLEETKLHGFMNIEKPSNSKCSKLAKQDQSEANGSGSNAEVKEGDVQRNFPDKKQHTVVGNTYESYVPVAENKYDLAQWRTTTGDVSIVETCSFMRSAASLKEWANTKAALSGSHKRKGNQK